MLTAAAFSSLIMSPGATFEIKDHQFLLQGKPFLMIAGEIHPARIPEPYWKHRIQMAKAMGLNTLSVYVFWNYHERTKGKFTWSGNANVAKFVRLAKDAGLYVILRPGPYVCAEWEFGGFPWWLLREKDMQIRQNNPAFLEASGRWLKALGEQVAPLQVDKGGNILMVQVENEYGSFGKDKAYLGAIRDQIRAAGFTVPLYTADGPDHMMDNGKVSGAFPAVNGVGADDVARVMDQHGEGGPYFVPEFYPGWLCHWGEKFPRVDSAGVAQEFEAYLKRGISVSIYMWHGGTNFGTWNGANYGKAFEPHITSYDYDAPLTEAGHATPKYDAMRAVVERLNGSPLPRPPAAPPVIAFESDLTPYAPLDAALGKPVTSDQPQTMEQLNQGYGFVLYRKKATEALVGSIEADIRDYAIVMVNGQKVGTLDRRLLQNEIQVNVPAGGTLEILVENMGRVNYGGQLLHGEKGIVGPVTLNGTTLKGWEQFTIPLASTPKKSSPVMEHRPMFLRSKFHLSATGDTWLDMRKFGKGMVWVNGHNVGRYWQIGPQQTLYVPGCWLRRGDNEIVVLEEIATAPGRIAGLEKPILDEQHSPDRK